MGQEREGRQWVILESEYDCEEDFRDAVTTELARLENMGHRLGRGFVVTPLRQGREIGDPPVLVYDTVGWAFRETFMPAVRDAAQALAQPAQEPEAGEPETAAT